MPLYYSSGFCLFCFKYVRKLKAERRQTTHFTMVSHISFLDNFSISSILVLQILLFSFSYKCSQFLVLENGFSGSEPFIKTPVGFLAPISGGSQLLVIAISGNLKSLDSSYIHTHRFKNNNKSKNKLLVFDISDFHCILERSGYCILRFCNLI